MFINLLVLIFLINKKEPDSIKKIEQVKFVTLKINPNMKIKFLNIFNDYNAMIIDDFLLNIDEFSNDNFYDSFNDTNLSRYSLDPKHPYPGNQYLINLVNGKQFQNQLFNIVGNKLENFNNTTLREPCFFSVGKKFKVNNKFTTNPHIDSPVRHSYAAMIFLNKNDDCYGGTGIYKSKVLNNVGPVVDGQLIKPENFNKLYEVTDIIKDSTDKWELVTILKMKHNRMVIYEKSMFHSIYLESFDLFKKYRYTINIWFDAPEDDNY